MNSDRDRALFEMAQRTPLWACLLVFAVLAADTGFRLASAARQRKQLDAAQLVQAQNVGRMSEILAGMPQLETRLQALSIDLVQVAKTNTTAAQIVRDFNIQWNPGPEAYLPPPAVPAAASGTTVPAASAAIPTATNAPVAK